MRSPLTQPKDFTNASNIWKVAKFIWCNKTISSGAVAWRIYFFDDAGNTNATDIKILHITTIDLNGDGLVDIMDIAMVAKAYGTKPGDRKWNPIADVAEPYGEINIMDIVTVAKNYGKRV